MTKHAQNPVLVLAGGTGGHIFPALALCRALSERAVPVLWLGSRAGMEARMVPEAGFPFEGLSVRGRRGKGLLALLMMPFALVAPVWAAVRLIGRNRPRCVVSFGGYAAGPGGIAAWLRRVPLLVHEQNRVPGLTNRVLSRLARSVLVGFPDAFPARRAAEWVGNPVRAEIAALAPPEQRLAGRDGPIRLLVLGGSQGARALNSLLPKALALLPEAERPEIRHQCGAAHLEDCRAAYREAGLEVSPEAFIADMAAAYSWADCVLCRSGALTLAEVCAAGLASLLVPYPHAVDDHQTRNAEFLVAAGAAELLPESGLSAETLARTLSKHADRGLLIERAQKARALARPDAAAAVAEACIREARS